MCLLLIRIELFFTERKEGHQVLCVVHCFYCCIVTLYAPPYNSYNIIVYDIMGGLLAFTFTLETIILLLFNFQLSKET